VPSNPKHFQITTYAPWFRWLFVGLQPTDNTRQADSEALTTVAPDDGACTGASRIGFDENHFASKQYRVPSIIEPCKLRAVVSNDDGVVQDAVI